jgi:S1-C subfamily serine protease
MKDTDQNTSKVQKNTSQNKKRSINLSKSNAQKLMLILTCLVAGIFGGMLGNSGIRSQSKTQTNVQKQIISNESQLINQIVKDVGPSVVSVNVTSVSARSSIFGQNQAHGKCWNRVILNTEGAIITNSTSYQSDIGKCNIRRTHDDVEVIGRTMILIHQMSPLK